MESYLEKIVQIEMQTEFEVFRVGIMDRTGLNNHQYHVEFYLRYRILQL